MGESTSANNFINTFCEISFGSGVWCSGFRVEGSGFRFQGSGFRVRALEVRAEGCGEYRLVTGARDVALCFCNALILEPRQPLRFLRRLLQTSGVTSKKCEAAPKRARI